MRLVRFRALFLVVLLLFVLFLQLLLVLLGQVAANQAACRSSDQTMMVSVMPGNAADDCPLDAALRVCRNACERKRWHQKRA